ncbi:hypothetical protein Rxyl_1426 [Rubrobacter xylanophilus DSM 9941]|uniref:Histidine kinase/HSP90-like ATPase domain-containing protein n=1 Tax=Rubrobacter xylanophilus (strain DSM 9941 / JCM 11954 / NBRC 16129 / PRD-1) TaxID=266117 RepID=Q1AW40_RUBXD|nr:ATP-binding protein [Rubrobacter xylanophilus]ABG04388.1 hypothetical protein Rxyl_1426 [Rubrobacter xylanophilus DSM 9941]
MEGPYRDLGSGFARLSGVEGPRRSPSRISCVEDALLEMLRNARDAGASRIFVATALRSRRYRTLTVLDDGRGVPEPYAELIFEPGVTSRHLSPVRDGENTPHGAGLSLYHIRQAALEARLLHPSSPTAFHAVFDTSRLPERSLQSPTRPSRSNLLATCRAFAARNPTLSLHHGTPAAILASLLHNRIIQGGSGREVHRAARRLGLGISLRTVQRVLRGEVRGAGRMPPGEEGTGGAAGGGGRPGSGPVLYVGEEDRARIADILSRAAQASYLKSGELRLEARPGEVVIRVSVYEPEEEYDHY